MHRDKQVCCGLVGNFMTLLQGRINVRYPGIERLHIPQAILKELADLQYDSQCKVLLTRVFSPGTAVLSTVSGVQYYLGHLLAGCEGRDTKQAACNEQYY